MAQVALSTKIEISTHMRLDDLAKHVEESKAKMVDTAINEYIDRLEREKAV